MKHILALMVLVAAIAANAQPITVAPKTNLVATASIPPLRLNPAQTQLALSSMATSLSNANVVAFSPDVAGKVREIHIRVNADGSSYTTFTLR